jgi:multidrug efflux system outer membrane protein
MKTLPIRTGILVSLSTLLVSGCSLAPTYIRPDTPTPLAFKEASSQPLASATADGPQARWSTARPADQMPRGAWWTIFADPRLDALEQQASSANQGLKAAMARVEEARALQRSTRADLLPSVGAGFGPTRAKVSPASLMEADGGSVPPQTLWRAQATASYEVDLFGRATSELNAAKAETDESRALFRSVLLTLQADVAQSYFNLRELDAEIQVYRTGVDLRVETLKLVQQRFDAGDISALDVARSRAELASARSDQMTAERARAVGEHALAVLTGQPAADFRLAPSPIEPVRIHVPTGVPSTLLERRPDIAAAERAVAAANARIGVARAAYFPSLSLNASGGYEAGAFSNLFKTSSEVFLLGPLAGAALTLPLFDGGRRRAGVQRARAVLDERTATYREQVLTAFQEVEDRLSDLRILEAQTRTQQDAVQASRQAEAISNTQYKEGAATYLDVIDAERTVLQAQQQANKLTGIQAVSTVNLIRALGGGWGDKSTDVAAADAGEQRREVDAAK